MKRKNLSLKQLEVTSFVTSLQSTKQKTVKGGAELISSIIDPDTGENQCPTGSLACLTYKEETCPNPIPDDTK